MNVTKNAHSLSALKYDNAMMFSPDAWLGIPGATDTGPALDDAPASVSDQCQLAKCSQWQMVNCSRLEHGCGA